MSRVAPEVYRRRRLNVAAALALIIAVITFAATRGNGGAKQSIDAGATTTDVSQPTGKQATAPTTQAATTTRPRRTVKVAFTGDTLVHSAVYNQAKTYGTRSGKGYDFGPMFDRVRAELSAADLAICHQETALSPDSKQVAGFPLFSTPFEIVDALKGAGYDGCSTASNHSLDRGAQGVLDTIGVFEQAGLKQSGLARSAEENTKATLYKVNGVTIAHLAYSYGLNGLTLPPDKPWLVRLINRGRESPVEQAYTSQFILADAKAARAAGADVVIIGLQWGAEYQPKPTPAQTALANELLASPDVDLIVGHHVHVIQPIDKVGDKYVVYGVGNFLSNQSPQADPSLPPSSQDGVIVNITFTEGDVDGSFKVAKVAYTPTWVDRSTYTITPVAAALKDAATPAATKAALTQSWQRTTTAINGLGAADKGVAPTDTP